MKENIAFQIFEVIFGAVLYYFASWLIVMAMASMAHIPLEGSQITFFTRLSLGACILVGVLCGLVLRKMHLFWSALLAVLAQFVAAYLLVHSIIRF